MRCISHHFRTASQQLPQYANAGNILALLICNNRYPVQNSHTLMEVDDQRILAL